LYKLIFSLLKYISIYIFYSILSLFSLKFKSSSILYTKRPRSPDSENKEKSAWKKRQEDIQEIEMDLKDLKKEIKEAENAAKIENNTSFSHEVKSNNSHLRHIERNYSEFFDTNDDHQTTNKGLNRVIEYLKNQEKTFTKELEELKKTPNQALDDLPSEMPNITEENE
jgi:chaperonin cofactor prefoldin